MSKSVRETLEKQLQLLSERSREEVGSLSCDGLAKLASAMSELAEAIFLCRDL